jgi:hypothetical protein
LHCNAGNTWAKQNLNGDDEMTKNIVICKKCGQENRLPDERTVPGIYRCGNCRAVLRNDLPWYMRAVRGSTWITFFPLAAILVSFSSLLLYVIGDHFTWWISLLITAPLAVIVVFATYWPLQTTPRPGIAAVIFLAFWALLEIFTLATKGLMVPWQLNVIRLYVDIAIVAGALMAMRKGSRHATGH